jgi:hypothetical protein
MRIQRGLVDARYKPDDVEAALRESKLQAWMPAYGVGVGAKDRSLGAFLKKGAAIHGLNWMIYKPQQRTLVSLFIDVNYWKTQTHQALSVPIDHGSSISLFDATKSRHQLFVDHLCAELAIRVEAKGKIVDEWQLPSNKPDNHFWDNLVACMAAASSLGIRRPSDHVERIVPRRPLQRVKSLTI